MITARPRLLRSLFAALLPSIKPYEVRTSASVHQVISTFQIPTKSHPLPSLYTTTMSTLSISLQASAVAAGNDQVVPKGSADAGDSSTCDQSPVVDDCGPLQKEHTDLDLCESVVHSPDSIKVAAESQPFLSSSEISKDDCAEISKDDCADIVNNSIELSLEPTEKSLLSVDTNAIGEIWVVDKKTTDANSIGEVWFEDRNAGDAANGAEGTQHLQSDVKEQAEKESSLPAEGHSALESLEENKKSESNRHGKASESTKSDSARHSKDTQLGKKDESVQKKHSEHASTKTTHTSRHSHSKSDQAHSKSDCHPALTTKDDTSRSKTSDTASSSHRAKSSVDKEAKPNANSSKIKPHHHGRTSEVKISSGHLSASVTSANSKSKHSSSSSSKSSAHQSGSHKSKMVDKVPSNSTQKNEHWKSDVKSSASKGESAGSIGKQKDSQAENGKKSTDASAGRIDDGVKSASSGSFDRKRKLFDSSPEVARKPSALEIKRAKLLALVEERKKESGQSDESADASGDSARCEKNADGGSKGKGCQIPSNVHPELVASNRLIFEPCGLICTSKPVREAESAEYGAFDLSLNNRKIKFRVAKITPTKNGQFVTLWKRIGKGPIMPYDMKDPVDLFVVCVREGKNFGHFVFPKSVLALEDIVSRGGKGGKRAIRVYAPWVKAESPQAVKTQNWQIRHFVNLCDRNGKLDQERVKKLYAC